MSIEKILVPKDHDRIIADLQHLGVDEEILKFIACDNEAFINFWHFWQNSWIGLTDARKKVVVNQLIAFIKLVMKAERNK